MQNDASPSSPQADSPHEATDQTDPADPYLMALRDLERKRAQIDAAIAAILTLRPDLR